jgi:hypothetical protein
MIWKQMLELNDDVWIAVLEFLSVETIIGKLSIIDHETRTKVLHWCNLWRVISRRDYFWGSNIETRYDSFPMYNTLTSTHHMTIVETPLNVNKTKVYTNPCSLPKGCIVRIHGTNFHFVVDHMDSLENDQIAVHKYFVPQDLWFADVTLVKKNQVVRAVVVILHVPRCASKIPGEVFKKVLMGKILYNNQSLNFSKIYSMKFHAKVKVHYNFGAITEKTIFRVSVSK